MTAYRLGIVSAKANVGLQRANRFPGRLFALSAVHVPEQRTFWQAEWDVVGGGDHGSPAGVQPQPGQHRACQDQRVPDRGELAYQEKRVETEVRQAIKEYQVSGQIADRIRLQVLPGLEQAYRDRLKLFQEGEVTKIVFLDAQRSTTRWPKPISTRRCVIAAACCS